MVNGIDVKRILYNEPKLIEDLLKSLGCRHIYNNGRRISSTRPNGDNKNSVNIALNETLNAKIYTRQSEFQQYEIQDIISLTQYFLDCSLSKALEYICSICNINGLSEYVKQEDSPTLSFLKRYKKIIRNETTTDDIILDDKILDLFVNAPCKVLTDDGINPFTQEQFEVVYDIMTNRAVFPIRNENGELITLKGRTMASDYKILGLPKYFVYYEVETSHLLFGEWINKDYIKNSNNIILFESEKSVMKAYQSEIYNCVAIGRKSISRHQRNKLLTYGKEIIICFDKDVKENELKVISKMFKNLVPVSYTLDRFDLLDSKDAPIDCGIDKFKELIETRIEFKE